METKQKPAFLSIDPFMAHITAVSHCCLEEKEKWKLKVNGVAATLENVVLCVVFLGAKIAKPKIKLKLYRFLYRVIVDGFG